MKKELKKQIINAKPGTKIQINGHHGSGGLVRNITVEIIDEEDFQGIVEDTVLRFKEFLHEPDKLDPDDKYELPEDFIRERFFKMARQQPYADFEELWDWPLPPKEEAPSKLGGKAGKVDAWKPVAFHALENTETGAVHLTKVLQADSEVVSEGSSKARPTNTDIQKFNDLLARAGYPLQDVVMRMDLSKADGVEILSR